MPPQQENARELSSQDFYNQRGTSTGTAKAAATDHDNHKKLIQVGCCAVKEIGLENFIRRIVLEINLHLVDNVVFNLNERGILHRWKDVFEVEGVYSRCLGISDRFYQCHGYTHEPQQRLVYFVLEEYNKRIWSPFSLLPDFKFYVVVFCYYGADRAVTKVDVQYDQMSFFLHCLGIMQLHRWISGNVLTPFAICWMRVYKATGTVHPITFLVQIGLAIWLLSKTISSS